MTRPTSDPAAQPQPLVLSAEDYLTTFFDTGAELQRTD